MMKYLYNFVVFKRDLANYAQSAQPQYHTIYSAESEKEYDDRSFSFVASRIVLAERVMLFNTTVITHVVAYEITPRKWMDDETITHTLIPSVDLFGLSCEGVTGARGGYYYSQYFGLRWRVNVEMGKCIDAFFPGCVGRDDVFTKEDWQWWNPSIYLAPNGPLAQRCFRFYANQLAQMPQIKPDVSIDRFGAVKRYLKPTGGRMVSHITFNHKLQRRRHAALPHTKFIEGVLFTATQNMKEGLREYNQRMNQFDHLWGDDHLPPSGAGFGFFNVMSAVWYPLMKAFGYQFGEGDFSSIEEHYPLAEWLTGENPEVVKWAGHGLQIHKCLLILHQSQQWIEYFFGLKDWTGFEAGVYQHWKRGEYPQDMEIGNVVFKDWEQLTATFFRAVDALNVLNMIVMIKEVAPLRGAEGSQWFSRPAGPPYPLPTEPVAIPFTPFLEVYPLAALPYYETPRAEPFVPEEIEEESIEWDSGTPEPVTEGEEDDWAAQFKEAIRTALAKLETVRRWIGKIRRQMPWYRAFPMERLAPNHDESKNPFTGEDIPDD
jgi:hypothetical protein